MCVCVFKVHISFYASVIIRLKYSTVQQSNIFIFHTIYSLISSATSFHVNHFFFVVVVVEQSKPKTQILYLLSLEMHRMSAYFWENVSICSMECNMLEVVRCVCVCAVKSRGRERGGRALHLIVETLIYAVSVRSIWLAVTYLYMLFNLFLTRQ